MASDWKKASGGEPRSVTEADGSASPSATAAFSFSDPNTWSVSGSASSDLWYWTGLKNVVEGAYCGSSSCTVTDRVTARSTVNPGTTASTIDTTVLYSPNGGNFTTRRWNFLAICSAVVCGNQAAINNNSSIHTVLTGYGNREGARLTIAVGLTQSSIANTVQTGHKTADCKGQRGSDKRCKYIYG